MRKFKKVLALTACAAMLVVGSVAGTLAYLTSQATVTNTFTVGKVVIELDEAKVNEDGEPLDANEAKVDQVENAVRVSSNDYKLVPGKEYVKDPTLRMVGPSEKAYAYMTVTVNGYDKLTAALTDPSYYSEGIFLLQKLCNWTEISPWKYKGCKKMVNNEGIVTSAEYRFVYDGNGNESGIAPVEKVAEGTKTALDPLFNTITVPGKDITNDNIDKLKEVKIIVKAYAIQEATFNDYNAAWKAGFGNDEEKFEINQ